MATVFDKFVSVFVSIICVSPLTSPLINVFVLFVFIIGIASYLLLEKDDINFFSGRFVGVYTLLLIILVFTHFISVEDNSMLGGDFSTFITNTFNTIKLAFSNEGIVKLTGGGSREQTGAFAKWMIEKYGK